MAPYILLRLVDLQLYLSMETSYFFQNSRHRLEEIVSTRSVLGLLSSIFQIDADKKYRASVCCTSIF